MLPGPGSTKAPGKERFCFGSISLDSSGSVVAALLIEFSLLSYPGGAPEAYF